MASDTTALRPFFSFFGSKWRLAPKYPPPKYDTIIEPFAGSAGYSLRYPERQVILIERDPVVAAVWRWLIAANPNDILSLPTLKAGDRLSDYDLPQEARWLMGFWVNQTGAVPNDKVTKFGAVFIPNGGKGKPASRIDMYRKRVACQLSSIRHWTVFEGDYASAPSVKATWFVDPPYQVEGKKYRFGPDQIDYPSLGVWCQNRIGQTIVCENKGAQWLPFADFAQQQGATYHSKTVWNTEVVWLNETACAEHRKSQYVQSA